MNTECTCSAEDIRPHSCPFAEEINGNDDPDFCTCCEACEFQCMMDI